MDKQSDVHSINQFKTALSNGLLFCDSIGPECKLELVVPISFLSSTVFYSNYSCDSILGLDKNTCFGSNLISPRVL